jgi:trafficking protein particle complex subunit 9
MLQPSASVYLPPTISDANTNTWAHLERLSGVSGISRSLISSILGQGHGPWLLHLAPGERIAVLEMMAATYACLGYKRKEAYLLREVLGCVVDLLVCDRKDNEAQRVSLSVVIPSRQVQDDLKPSGSVNIKGNVSVRRGESSDGNESVLRLLKHVCTVLGVDIESVGLIVTEVDAQQNGNEQGNRAGSGGADFPEEDMDDSGDLSGWPELQVGVVREAVAVAEALPGLSCSPRSQYLDVSNSPEP